MNKKYSYVGIVFIILVFGIYVVRNLDERISNEKLIDNNRLNKKVNSFQKKDTSLYVFSKVPNFEFINQNGDTINNSFYLNKVYVVEFFFTTCPSICPIMNQKMLAIQEEFIDNLNFGIASISITPEIDTQEVMKQYEKNKGIKHKNWNLLTGIKDDIVYALANQGFKLYAGKGDEDHGGFEHSGLFALIDKEGYIRSRKDDYGNPIMYYRALEESGFPDQIQELKNDIKILLNENY